MRPLGIPVFPVVSYGVTPYFMAYPGTISLRVETHIEVVRDILDTMARTGFRRILIVNGHGGNDVVRRLAQEWSAKVDTFRVILHNWWNAPRIFAKTRSIDPMQRPPDDDMLAIWGVAVDETRALLTGSWSNENA